MLRIFTIMRNILIYFPHLLVYAVSKNKALLSYEIEKWIESHHLPYRRSLFINLINLLASYPEYRSLFYFRTGKSWLSVFSKGQNNLEFYTESDKIGKGLIIWHGFSTVINVKSMGEDCQIWQNVTIGKKSSMMVDDRPIIGDRVLISANSAVIGDITVADDVIVGASTCLNKSVDKPSVVVGASCRIFDRKDN